MRSFSPFPMGLAMAGLFAAAHPALAQEAPISAAAPASDAAPVAAEPPRVLFKLGTGITNGTGYGGFDGLTLPIIPGLEWQFAPGWSATANGSASWNFGPRRYTSGADRWGPSLGQLSLDASVRHYYHQDKRRQLGRRTGPYQGPYVALQVGNYFYSFRSYNSYARHRYTEYTYSNLMLLWGTQRRLGGHGLLDAYIGGGLDNSSRNYDGGNSYHRQLGLALELGLKLSLVNK